MAPDEARAGSRNRVAVIASKPEGGQEMSLLESFANMVGSARVGPVQRSVDAHGGHCTFPFTQCRPPVSTLIAMDRTTSGGICEALTAHWIRYHATADSLWNWLTPGGHIDLAKIQQHVMPLQSQGILGDQEAVTEAWLRQHGINRLQTNMVLNSSRNLGGKFVQFGGAATSAVQEGTSSFFNRDALARAILVDRTGGAGCYKKLWLAGVGGEHVMALWVAQDVVFFDPNFGEFWFGERARFFNWFTKSFWHTSLYSVGLSGRYELLPYAKAVA